MQHFPIFLAVAGRRIVVSGGGEAALAKLRLLLKTEAHLTVFAADPAQEIVDWAAQGKLTLAKRALAAGDALCAALFYAANEDDAEDARVTRLAQADGALTNWVDNLGQSQFITPAIVDRDPVTVAIGTEGAAPVLARAIKSDLEARLPVQLGLLARIGKTFRKAVEALPMGRPRRDFWSDYYFKTGPEALAQEGEAGIQTRLDALLSDHLSRDSQPGRVALVGAGPGDPELLTLKARRALDEADVVIYDRLVAPEILELARREALMINAGKEGFGPSMSQDEICRLIVEHAAQGAYVVRLKSGDPTVYGRLDEEVDALDAAGVAWSIIPGITAASAAAAGIGQSLTKRDRNSALRFLTGHDVKGFAEHDWRGLARPGEVAAIYMAKKGARFLQGRLLMHGAAPNTPVTVVENASRADGQTLATTLARLPADIDAANMSGPAILLYGLAPRDAALALPQLQKDQA
ncbi:uroporphyrinogen-III C-methyltransferase [Roseobacter sp. HKCCD9010]|uniref:siroheme synthase CysG n=1 Tax=unclassified Roseobacter TaxID=196798 RepID=UPI001492B893|nr:MULTISPECIES: siroheme synthase CysG [unclassified Roseobacter]MBF9050042.1 uroporphyrinogen-III C-methyltransferase [Rhodobacterales bacterium HKCCD4356]NNV12285.1 uroporphyrinogen-III C-methyltransferase [Roseobacter sp. HKCCD7357]NNV16252.1 uroporphyrinogen-III C-methyltransferase [Roseobacter sp. HKCCD8768]NNV25712.1 uroporphyrinogen-III C-methyltransferase [Roseobacter sp. HKCCD8192]NNV29968.1 uroporphyrinogen-III C-methyltransferase [Roseobacter sp. HKCCD9061]